MTNKRRTFDASYKLQVANMIVEQGMRLSQVCKDMKFAESAVRRWVAQSQSEQGGLPGISKLLTAEKIRIRELECPESTTAHGVTAHGCRHVKKSIGLLGPGTEMSYGLVQQLQQKAIPTVQACHVLGVS